MVLECASGTGGGKMKLKWYCQCPTESGYRVARWAVTDLAIFFQKGKFPAINILATGKWFNEKQNKINQVTHFHNGQDKENCLSKGVISFSHHEYGWTVSQAPSKLEIRKIPLSLWLKTTVVIWYYFAYACDIR